MEAFFDFLSKNQSAAILVGIVTIIIAAIYLVAFLQGREIVLWTLRIGEQPENTKKASMRIGAQATKVSFKEWDDALFRERLETAKEICIVTLSNYDFITANAGRLRKFLDDGGYLRFLYVDPHGKCLGMARDRGYGAEKDEGHFTAQIIASLQRVRELSVTTKNPDNLQVKTIDHLPCFVLTLIDPKEPNAMALVTVNGFGVPFQSRPSFVLTKAKHEKWFTFYKTSYENMWNSSKCKEFDLATM